jgi:hypothetical protein
MVGSQPTDAQQLRFTIRHTLTFGASHAGVCVCLCVCVCARVCVAESSGPDSEGLARRTPAH